MTILVTGASGQLGQRVLHHLTTTLGVVPGTIVATTRNPDALADWAAKGVEVRRADFDDAESLRRAFAGVTRLLLISTDALDQPGRRLRQHRAAIEAAEDVGVDHLVYTSMPEPDDSPLLIAPDHAATEATLRASSLPGWTVLRNAWYFENIFQNIGQVLASVTWYSAAGDGRMAHIARDDLGLAAATALAGDADDKQVLTLTGAKAYTAAEIVALVSDVTGVPIQFVPVPTEALISGMTAAGVPEPMAQLIASFDVNTAAGRVATVTDDFKVLTGREPQPYEEWLRRNRDALLAVAPAPAA